jgi:hypothetical protein
MITPENRRKAERIWNKIQSDPRVFNWEIVPLSVSLNVVKEIAWELQFNENRVYEEAYEEIKRMLYKQNTGGAK